MSNAEPSNLVHDTMLRHTPFCHKKKSKNEKSCNYIYFIDDLNLNYSCSTQNLLFTKTTHKSLPNLELARQLLETHAIYSSETDYFMNLNEINFLFSCTYPCELHSYFISNK